MSALDYAVDSLLAGDKHKVNAEKELAELRALKADIEKATDIFYRCVLGESVGNEIDQWLKTHPIPKEPK